MAERENGITIENLTVLFDAERARDEAVFKLYFDEQMARRERAAGDDARAARERAIPEGRVAW